jgi:hypothetical protein
MMLAPTEYSIIRIAAGFRWRSEPRRAHEFNEPAIPGGVRDPASMRPNELVDYGATGGQCRHRRLFIAVHQAAGHRQLVGCGQKVDWARGDGDLYHSINAADFRPDLECLRPGGSVLGGSQVIAAEVKKVVDLIVG